MLPATNNRIAPAVLAGVTDHPEESPHRVTPEQAALFRLMETLGEGIALFDGGGESLIHTNTALRQLLSAEPDAKFRKELDRFARVLAGAGKWEGLATAEVQTCTGAYALRGSHLQANPIGGTGTAVMIAVQRAANNAPAGEQLAERFALTPSEAQVAVLIAVGRSNSEIATALFISPHTARHHTERVFSKLGVRSRAEAACKLLQT